MRRGGVARFSRTLYANLPFGAGEDGATVQAVLDASLLGGKELLNDISAFTRKRFVAKAEVWPKVHVLETVPSLRGLESLQPFLGCAQLMDATQLAAVQAARAASSHLLHSLLFEPHLPEMLREYARKLPVCGVEPALGDLPAFEPLRRAVRDLFRAFFRAELSPVDAQAMRHLALLCRESRLETLQSRDFHELEDETARLAGGLANYRVRDLEHFDDFLPVAALSSLDAAGAGPARLFPFSASVLRLFTRRTELTTETARLLRQLKLHVQSIEYSHCFELPQDFFVMSLQLFLHTWLVCQRLEQMGDSAEALFVRDELVAHVNNDVGDTLRPVHIRSKLLLTAETRKHFANVMNVLSAHFSVPPGSAQPLRQLDALVWSLLLREVAHRYHDTVFRLADYVFESWRAMRGRSFAEILAQPVALSVFGTSPAYKARLLRLNPPLSRAELEEERLSAALQKRYHYRVPTAEAPVARGEEEPASLRSLALTRAWRLARKRSEAEDTLQRLAALHDFFVAPRAPRGPAEGPWQETGLGSVQAAAAAKLHRCSPR